MSVNRYVALLRGINVGGRQKLAMADLRDALAALGHGDVKTHLQSGNAIFTSAADDPEGLARGIEEAVSRQHGLSVKVLVRTPDELAAVVAANPFPDAMGDPKRLHVAFLSAAADPDRLAAIDLSPFAPDELRAGDRALYLWYPNGAGRSKLTNNLLEKRLGLTATTRNWNTVTRLAAEAAS